MSNRKKSQKHDGVYLCELGGGESPGNLTAKSGAAYGLNCQRRKTRTGADS
jgi:hypothetical protein